MSEENKDLSAAVDRGLVEAANALRFFDLEWIALPEERARELYDAPEVARDRHYLVAMRRFAPHTLSRARGAHARRARPGRRERLADPVRPDHLHARGAVRRRGGRGAAHHRPAAGARARPRPRPAPAGAGDPVRRPGAPHQHPGPLLRHARGRPPGDGPAARLRGAHGPHPPAQRAARAGGGGHARRGGAPLRPRPSLVRDQGGDPRPRPARAARPVRAHRRRPLGGLPGGAAAHRRVVRALLPARGPARRAGSSTSAGSTPSRGRASAAAPSARRSPRTPRPTC